MLPYPRFEIEFNSGFGKFKSSLHFRIGDILASFNWCCLKLPRHNDISGCFQGFKLACASRFGIRFDVLCGLIVLLKSHSLVFWSVSWKSALISHTYLQDCLLTFSVGCVLQVFFVMILVSLACSFTITLHCLHFSFSELILDNPSAFPWHFPGLYES